MHIQLSQAMMTGWVSLTQPLLCSRGRVTGVPLHIYIYNIVQHTAIWPQH